MRHGTLIVVAGPSGVGKGSLDRRLLARDPDGLALSVSATTRPPRPSETDGVDYAFVAEDRFDEMIQTGELLEWAEIVGHRSGTPRQFVEEQRRAGRDVILEIDVKGAQQVRDQLPDAVLIFLMPPSFEELERRLRSRGPRTNNGSQNASAPPGGSWSRRAGSTTWSSTTISTARPRRSLLSSRGPAPADLQRSSDRSCFPP